MKNNKFKIYKEKNKHGSTLFPFVIYDNLIPEFFTQFPIHWHEEVEIVYVHKGMAIYNIDYNRLIVEEGDILYISPSFDKLFISRQRRHSYEQDQNWHFRCKPWN